mgnify:CR=1 FL=1
MSIKKPQPYQPFVKVQDISSLGRSHRVFGHKSGRTHHLLSDLELSVFYEEKMIPQSTLKVYWGDEYLKTIDTLIVASLLEKKIVKNEIYYVLHDLQNDYVKSLESDLKNKYEKLINTYHNHQHHFHILFHKLHKLVQLI